MCEKQPPRETRWPGPRGRDPPPPTERRQLAQTRKAGLISKGQRRRGGFPGGGEGVGNGSEARKPEHSPLVLLSRLREAGGGGGGQSPLEGGDTLRAFVF